MAKGKKTAKDRPSAKYSSQGDAKGFFLKVVAIWFDGTILDTNDISTSRGGSLALLFAPLVLEEKLQSKFGKDFNIKPIISGASTLILCFEPQAEVDLSTSMAKVEEFTRKFLSTRQNLALENVSDDTDEQSLDLSYLRFTVSTVPQDLAKIVVASDERQARGENEQADAAATGQFAPVDVLAALDARAAVAQYNTLSTANYIATPPDREFDGRMVCELDRISPAYDKDATSVVCASVEARRRFGRARKKDFFLHILKDATNPNRDEITERLDGLGFSQSLNDLTPQKEDHPSLQSIAQNLRGKIAIIHFDGNKFGRFVNHPNIADRSAFSEQLRKHQANMLCDLLDWFVPEGKTSPDDNPLIARESRDKNLDLTFGNRVRLEVLLWGGDEVALAVPAWCAMDVLEILDNSLRQFSINWSEGPSESLTHAIGLCFCPHKMPIRTMRTIAGALADSGKKNPDEFSYNIAQIDTIDMDSGGIEAHRKAAFGAQKNQDLCWRTTGEDGNWKKIHEQLKELFTEISMSRVSRLTKLLPASDEKAKAKLDSELKRLYGSAEKSEEVKGILNSSLFGKDMETALKWRIYLNGFILPSGSTETRRNQPAEKANGGEIGQAS